MTKHLEVVDLSVCDIYLVHAIFADLKLSVGKDFDFSSQTAGNLLPPSHSAHLLSGSSGVHDELQASLSASSNICTRDVHESCSSSDIFQSQPNHPRHRMPFGMISLLFLF